MGKEFHVARSRREIEALPLHVLRARMGAYTLDGVGSPTHPLTAWLDWLWLGLVSHFASSILTGLVAGAFGVLAVAFGPLKQLVALVVCLALLVAVLVAPKMLWTLVRERREYERALRGEGFVLFQILARIPGLEARSGRVLSPLPRVETSGALAGSDRIREVLSERLLENARAREGARAWGWVPGWELVLDAEGKGEHSIRLCPDPKTGMWVFSMSVCGGEDAGRVWRAQSWPEGVEASLKEVRGGRVVLELCARDVSFEVRRLVEDRTCAHEEMYGALAPWVELAREALGPVLRSRTQVSEGRVSGFVGDVVVPASPPMSGESRCGSGEVVEGRDGETRVWWKRARRAMWGHRWSDVALVASLGFVGLTTVVGNMTTGELVARVGVWGSYATFLLYIHPHLRRIMGMTVYAYPRVLHPKMVEERSVVVRLEGSVLWCGEDRVDLSRAFSKVWTCATDREGEPCLGLLVSQQRGGERARIALRIPVVRSVWLESLPRLESSAPELSGEALDRWLLPALAFYDEVQGGEGNRGVVSRAVEASVGRLKG